MPAVSPFSFPDLPITAVLPALQQTLEDHNCVVLEAAPGAGKTTLVPLAMLGSTWLGEGKIVMLEPRRLAAKAAAQRMADLLGEKTGQTVGYRVRNEKSVSANTRIEIVTEGILTRMLQNDPALEGISAIIFDEFHERSLQADLGLALSLDAQAVLRPDLRLVIMSATLDAASIANWLNAPVISSQGRQFPIETQYLSPAELATAGNSPWLRLTNLVPKAILKALKENGEGDVLVFLPGLGEMRKIADITQPKLPNDVQLHLLHGELTLQHQQAAIQPAPTGFRKVVLATSIAETSLTIQGVRIVIDGGFARVPRFQIRTGLTTLITTPVSVAAANQRRGRAGRLGPGVCYRLWTAADQLQLPPHLAPEITEADLSSLTLELAIWGTTDITSLKWLNIPPAAAISQATELLKKLEALTENGKPTTHGRDLASLGLTPRLGHLVRRGHDLQLGATACALAALLSERDLLKNTEQNQKAVFPDLQARLEIFAGKRPHLPGFVIDENTLRRIREQATILRQRLGEKDSRIDPETAGLLTAFAYPERIAQRETSGRVRLATGQKAKLATELFSETEFYSIAHLETGNQPEVLLAAPISKAEIQEHFGGQVIKEAAITWDDIKERVSARQIIKLGALNLEETQLKVPNQDEVALVLLRALQEKPQTRLPLSVAFVKLLERLNFLHHHFPETWPEISLEMKLTNLENWLLPHLTNLKSLAEVAKLDLPEIILSEFSWEKQNQLQLMAPTHLEVPTGSRIQIDYQNPESPVLAVRLQEIFGVFDTPRIAGGQVTLLIHLLSPASRPVQVTQDLRSFWANGYFEVRKDLRGRYPKHHWPEDPLLAEPVKGIKRKPK